MLRCLTISDVLQSIALCPTEEANVPYRRGARHWCELLTVRPHHRSDPEGSVYRGRSTVEDVCSPPRWYYWNCAYSTRNGISGSFSIGATCSNISEAGLTLSTPMYRRNLAIYRAVCVRTYQYAGSPCKTRASREDRLHGTTVSTLIIPRRTCWFLFSNALLDVSPSVLPVYLYSSTSSLRLYLR